MKVSTYKNMIIYALFGTLVNLLCSVGVFGLVIRMQVKCSSQVHILVKVFYWVYASIGFVFFLTLVAFGIFLICISNTSLLERYRRKKERNRTRKSVISLLARCNEMSKDPMKRKVTITGYIQVLTDTDKLYGILNREFKINLTFWLIKKYLAKPFNYEFKEKENFSLVDNDQLRKNQTKPTKKCIQCENSVKEGEIVFRMPTCDHIMHTYCMKRKDTKNFLICDSIECEKVKKRLNTPLLKSLLQRLIDSEEPQLINLEVRS